MVNGVGDVFSGVVLVQVWVDGWNSGLCSSDCCLTLCSVSDNVGTAVTITHNFFPDV
jgi:hypothetical protein